MDAEQAEYLVERYGDLLVRVGYTWLGDRGPAGPVAGSGQHPSAAWRSLCADLFREEKITSGCFVRR